MKRRRSAKVRGHSDDFTITPEKDNKDSQSSGLNITAVKHPEFRHRKPKK